MNKNTNKNMNKNKIVNIIITIIINSHECEMFTGKQYTTHIRLSLSRLSHPYQTTVQRSQWSPLEMPVGAFPQKKHFAQSLKVFSPNTQNTKKNQCFPSVSVGSVDYYGLFLLRPNRKFYRI